MSSYVQKVAMMRYHQHLSNTYIVEFMKDLHDKRAKVETWENQHLGDSGEEESVREAKRRTVQ